MMKEFFIFTRSGGKYGMGHLSRMIQLGMALRLLDRDVTIITNEDSLSHVPDRGIGLYTSNNEDELPSVIINSALSMRRLDSDPVLIIDDKFVSNGDLGDIDYSCDMVAVDLPHAQSSRYDLLVLPNAHMSMIDLETCNFTGDNLLYGRDYILTGGRKDNGLVYNKDPKSTIVSFFAGASDPYNELSLLFKYSNALPGRIGRVYMYGAQADVSRYKYFDIMPFNHGLIEISSLFVTMWGVTMYESLAMGIPTLSILRDEKDIPRAKELSRASDGALSYLEPGFTHMQLHRQIRGELEAADWLKRRSEYAVKFVDGLGADRLAMELSGRY